MLDFVVVLVVVVEGAAVEVVACGVVEPVVVVLFAIGVWDGLVVGSGVT